VRHEDSLDEDRPLAPAPHERLVGADSGRQTAPEWPHSGPLSDLDRVNRNAYGRSVGCACSWSARELLPGLGVFVLLSTLAFSSGGFFPSTWGLATLALLAALAAVAACARHVDAGRLDAVLVAALGALAAWSLLSVAWSVAPAATVLEAQRTLLYVVAASVLLVAARASAASLVLTAVLAACTAVAVGALAAGGARPLAAPVGYSNALGILAAIGCVLAAGFVLERRFTALAAGAPLGLALWLSGSRAAVVAALVGLAVTAALPRGRRAAGLAALAVTASLGIGAWAAGNSLRAREPIWSVAGRAAAEHPVLGIGAGGFDRVWWRERPVRRGARDAHSLYLETLAELGPLGVALLAAALAVPLVAAARARGAPLVPAAAGAYTAYLVHAGVDWDWEMPAVTLAALACAGALMLAARGDRAPRVVTGRARIVAAGVVAAVAAVAYAGYEGSAALDRTHAALTAGAPATAAAAARQATRWEPWSGEPWLAVGEAALRRGELATARSSLRRGLAHDAGDWELWAALAHASGGAERRLAAGHAAALNPLGRFRD
jgi:O-antigen ligase